MKRPNSTIAIATIVAAAFAFTSGCGGSSSSDDDDNATFHVGGTVAGLQGNLFVALNGSESVSITADGPYQFSTALQNGAPYSVTISEQPATQTCTVQNGSGSINLANASIPVTCTTTQFPPAITHVWPESVFGGYEVKISGSSLDLATITFNGAAIEPTLRTPHELRFIAPENSAGNYVLELENHLGTTSQMIKQGEAMRNVVAISSGGDHNCAVLNTGTVRCWGANDANQLGAENYDGNSSTPLTVSGITNAVSVSTAGEVQVDVMGTRAIGHSCALLSTGEVTCWGRNSSGQLGDENFTYAGSAPVMVAGVTNATAVSVSDRHS